MGLKLLFPIPESDFHNLYTPNTNMFIKIRFYNVSLYLKPIVYEMKSKMKHCNLFGII